MSNKCYYKQWLQIKKQLEATLHEDERIQELAVGFVGVKPQSTAVEIVARAYCQYCELYNKLCECYDQMVQVQRRPFICNLINAITCRIIELKSTLEEVEVFEYTYPDNALQQMLMVPQDIQILCPFHYPFEIRQEEMQYIVDQVFAGNRLGDPTPSPSEIERREQEKLEEEERIRAEKEAEVKRKLAMGEEISDSAESVELSPQELEKIRLEHEYNSHIWNIQRMERSRCTVREKTHIFNKNTDLYLELAGLKAPPASEYLRKKAAALIQKIYRRFLEIKREHMKENKIKYKLDMIIPSCPEPSAKTQLEKVKEARRNFRQKYYKAWLKQNLKEQSRVFKLREGDVMEDISAEIRDWLQTWYAEVRVFDEFPYPEEGGSILIVKGETFTIEEYIEWRLAEEKRLKAMEGQQKSKEEIKAERLAAREEEKRLKLEAKLREEKRLLDYKKQRLNPDNDPGIYFKIGKNIMPVREMWNNYENQWKYIDIKDASLDVIKGHIMNIITENAYQELQSKLRPIVDELMRIEYNMLKNALKMDCEVTQTKPPLVKKRKKPKKVKPPKPEKIPPAVMFQALVDEGIIRKYPRTTLDDFWGDRNYAAADTRGILWTPKFPPHCLGDVKEQVRIRCLLTLGSSCPDAVRNQLIVGPKNSGKSTLVYAIATETNSILIDLSPMNVYNKFPGPKNLKTMFAYINKISRMMQPTIIFVEDADKIFCKTVPKEEKAFDPKRLQKDFFKEIIKPINPSKDKILVLGTAAEPWLAKGPLMYKVFPSLILMPRTDYGSISYTLTKMLMQYHGVDRDFNVHSLAQVLRGYDINSIKESIQSLLNGNRIAQLPYKPLEPKEVINAVLENPNTLFTKTEDYDMYKEWYESYSPWGSKYLDYLTMLESQLNYKLKEKKK
ncbi:dynein regulatory complex protein 11-like [Bicyclus anynana]|uniref:Dynein regulatory complex protein 11-like n=1 Tax=Bicyclus anynana TaxID=110368 RepID=A0A6J1MM55_BICAN|nr:dynein regulatory complex protein 11-like [Bicyclus anynana]